ncbi:hypothetical protein ICW_05661 [Bacillus wiedmannii]|uniref:hypothetical protein n=1 Tax=Bacillus wiedmannii TaxID=1890302 RepID=UPI00027AB89C|nr:hypothetical protein ICW_05661 [Bacillus wiedmannii]
MNGQDHKGVSDIKRYEGTQEYMLFRREPGFGDKQKVWLFDVFTYQELMDRLNDGWQFSVGITPKKKTA